MIKKNLATLAFFSAAMTGMVQAAEDLRSDRNVAKEAAACAVTALSTGVQQLPLGVDVGHDYAFNALHRVSSRVLGPMENNRVMLEKSLAYDLAAQNLKPDKLTDLIRSDIRACQRWFRYAAENAARETEGELRGIPSCGPQTGPKISI